MSLWNGEEGREYTIRSVDTEDEALNSFLFSLGCYGGEPIRLAVRQRKSCVVTVKNGRYSFDRRLCEAISI